MNEQTIQLLMKSLFFLTIIWTITFIYIVIKSEEKKKVSRLTKIVLLITSIPATIHTSGFMFYLMQANFASFNSKTTIYNATGGIPIQYLAWASIILSAIFVIFITWITIKTNNTENTK